MTRRAAPRAGAPSGASSAPIGHPSGASDPLLLERDEQLAVLDQAVGRAAEGSGSTVFVAGEPGIGKTALLQSWTDGLGDRARVLRGACDDLATPRTLGAIRDLAVATDGPLAHALASDATRDTVLDAALREVRDPLRPTVVVIDDLHWADEATLDVIRFLRRRLDDAPCVLVLAHRDEFDDGHPLHQLLGETTGAGVARLHLDGLSAEAVRRLAGDLDRSTADRLRSVTGGNPFLVLELRGADPDKVPPSVRDAVSARLRSLPSHTRAALEQLAVEPGRLELGLLARLVEDAATTLAAAERQGLVTVELGTVRFRHELTRRAVLAALPGASVAVAHARVLAELDPRTTDAARLVHHALGAGDAETVARVAPSAARQAVRAGAHRDAVTVFGHALRAPQLLSATDRRTVRTEYARELLLANRLDDALVQAELSASDPAVAEDPAALGSALRVLAEARYWGLRQQAALEAAEEAVTTLRPVGGRPLAEAATTLAFVRLMANRFDAAVAAADTAIELIDPGSDDPDDDAVRLRALTHRGTARTLGGDADGIADLRDALAGATERDLHEVVVEACVGSTSAWFRLGRIAAGERALELGLERAAAHDLRTGVATLTMMRAGLDLAHGDWNRAIEALEGLLGEGHGTGWGETVALAFLGRLRSRRGEPEALAPLERAWELASASGEVQRVGPAGAALLEWGWLHGRLAEVAGPVAEALAVARRSRHGWYLGELRRYLTLAGRDLPTGDAEHRAAVAPLLAGADDDPDDDTDGGSDHDPDAEVELAAPWAYGVARDAAAAATAWDELGWPYEAALERLAASDPEVQVAGLRALDRLGATATAAVARRHLRSVGLTRLPRGPQHATRSHPAGLTPRQVEVLTLLADGASNPQIAERLQLSVRTVDHHVSAILAKLGVSSRTEAAQQAPPGG